MYIYIFGNVLVGIKLCTRRKVTSEDKFFINLCIKGVIVFKYVLSYCTFISFNKRLSIGTNHIGGMMVIVIALSVVDHVFEPRSGQTKHSRIDVFEPRSGQTKHSRIGI